MWRGALAIVIAAFISANAQNGGVPAKAQQEETQATPPTTLDNQPSRQSEAQRGACPDTHQTKYDCNTVAAIANVRQADAADWFNNLAYVEIGVGFATAVFAFLAAIFAKQAVGAAQAALQHERDRTSAELRPWVSIEVNLTKFEASSTTIGIHYELVFANVGRTVASNFFFKSDSQWLPKLDVKVFDSQFAKWTEPAELGRFAIMPGEKKTYFGSQTTATDVIPWTGKKTRFVAFVVAASAFYRSPMDDRWHRTDRNFTIGRKGTGSVGDGFFIDEHMSGYDAEMLTVRPAYSRETT